MTFASCDPSPPDLLTFARRLALKSPQLTDLSASQLEHIAQVVILANLRDDLKRLADLSRIPLELEMKAFLTTASRTDSWPTIRTYAYGLSMLERWLDRKGLSMLELTPKQADDYIYTLRAEGRAPATIRIVVASAGAFFSFLERRFDAVRNPFRGTRARPVSHPVRPLVVPNDAELELLILSAPRDLKVAMLFMSGRGLRVGALPTLVIDKARFTGRSKAKDISGTLSPSMLESVERAGLDRRRPFAGYTAERLSDRVLRLSGRLFTQGLVRHPFSAHDLRHYFAVTTYKTDTDLYRLKVLLNHASVATTERYLRSLEVKDSYPQREGQRPGDQDNPGRCGGGPPQRG